MNTHFTDISKDAKTHYRITKPGRHIFFVHNRSGDLLFSLQKADVHVQIYGLYEGDSDDTFTLRTTQHHRAPNTSSVCMINGIFSSDARFSFDGLIRIEKKARGTEAHLTNRNLLLSPHAHVRTQPILEILPHDVICTHAATVGAPNEEQINFLISRGLTKKAATRLIVNGFRDELIKQLPTAYQKEFRS